MSAVTNQSGHLIDKGIVVSIDDLYIVEQDIGSTGDPDRQINIE
jgi:hypothetical protein